MLTVPDFMIRRKILEYLEEDIGYGDVTFVRDRDVRAEIVSKESGIVAGVGVAKIAFDLIGASVSKSIRDGDSVDDGDVILEINGGAKGLLAVERTVLNILMRMSGIATITAEMVGRARAIHPEIVIAATRKTTPGFRIFEKIAVEIGGGDTHRFGLSDCVIVKDNHIAVAGSLKDAVRLAKRASFTKKVEVEVKKPDDVILAAREGADIIMLDNFGVEDVRNAIEILEDEGLRDRVIVEVSGRISPTNVEEYAKTGVDVISSGYITHSAEPLDLSMIVSPS